MRRGAAAMTPPPSQPSSFAKGYGGQEGKAMKLKIDWKELGRRLWEAVKECLGGSLLTAVVASGETRARLGRGAALPRARRTLVSGETHACLGRDARLSRARHTLASGEGRRRLGRDTVTPRPRDAALLRRFRRGESGARPRIWWWFLREGDGFLRVSDCDVGVWHNCLSRRTERSQSKQRKEPVGGSKPR